MAWRSDPAGQSWGHHQPVTCSGQVWGGRIRLPTDGWRGWRLQPPYRPQPGLPTSAMLRGCSLLWRRGCSSQHEQVSHKVDLPIQMENPYKDPPKRCVLCGINVDYKNVQLLSQFVSPYTGRIYGRHITGLCGKKQKEIAKAIKRAHIMGFMPVMYKDPTFLNDPAICDIRHPDWSSSARSFSTNRSLPSTLEHIFCKRSQFY